jgi:CubicO group peptidase (beta-lactamase class C family)
MRKFALLAVWCVLPVLAQTKPTLAGFDEFVEKALRDWKVPGVAVAVVRDDEVILSKGYGLRNIKQKLPVTSKTLFAIGSSTKSFTVLSLGLLVEDGRLDWDKPVRDYLPAFRLHDQAATERMTPRDLVTHRSGLPRHDLVWYNSESSRKEMFERLRYLEPSRDFRSTYQYQNLMYMTAGYLAGHIADMPWEMFVKERIFKPLGMANSNFSVNESQTTGDFAVPYGKEKDEIKEIGFRNIDEIGPAGSINSSVEDLIRYVRLHLNGGKTQTGRLLSGSNISQMHMPQMVMPGALRWPELGHQQYGMGFFVTSYRGRKLVHHGGNIDGFSALVSFMPQDKTGIVILTNMGGTPLPTLLSYNIYDRLLNLEAVDWTARLKDDERKGKEAQEEAKKRGFTAQKQGTRPSHEFKEYAGDYEHPGYGILKVALDGDGLRTTFNRLGGPLRHFHYDVFEVAESDLNPLSKLKLRFQTNLQGEIDAVLVPMESSVKEIAFTRAPDRSMMDRAFLEPLAGDYALGATPVTITLRGDGKLILSLPGQTSSELVGVSGTKFHIKGLTGFSVEFKKDASGAVADLVFYQPNGTFVAKRK